MDMMAANSTAKAPDSIPECSPALRELARRHVNRRKRKLSLGRLGIGGDCSPRPTERLRHLGRVISVDQNIADTCHGVREIRVQLYRLFQQAYAPGDFIRCPNG